MRHLLLLLACATLGLGRAAAQSLPKIYLDSAWQILPSAEGARYRREEQFTADSLAGVIRTYYLPGGQLAERTNFEQAGGSQSDRFDEAGRLTKHVENDGRHFLELYYHPSGQLKRREYQGFGWLGRKKRECFAPDGRRIPYFEYETQPRYPEGDGKPATVIKVIRRSLRYPADALREHVEGRVFVAFTVSETGTVENVAALRAPLPSMGEEVVRVVSQLQRYEPGRLDGHPRKVKYILPIDFRLD